MVKIRSMVVNADRTGVDSTSVSDRRITAVGRTIRRYKLDELTQLWNVIIGDMSLVGPRPNVKRETDLYTPKEKVLLSVKPGISDFASIVFSDEGEILKGQADPDIAYNQLIRPWKSRFGLFYIKHQGIVLDLRLVVLTALAIVSRPQALSLVAGMLEQMGAEPSLVRVARRKEALVPTPPPGSTQIVYSR
jgi:lipopolysaccharide/colanic/teichoic acid biosynthesis glycosyltransferase